MHYLFFARGNQIVQKPQIDKNGSDKVQAPSSPHCDSIT